MKLRNAHKDLLKRLTFGPKSTKSFTHGDSGNSQLGVHFQRYLDEMAQQGLVVVISQHGEDMWHITEHGRKNLDAPKVATTRKIVAGTTVGDYDGRELTRTCQRPGAYDFLAYPSLMGDERIYRGVL
jgi:uncharacterized Rossmann fold enzyme